MENNSPQKELIIAVVEHDDAILMRKKPAGSPPYAETWYLFGCERVPAQDDSITIKAYLKTEIGVDVDIIDESLPFGFETKRDHDGVEKNFVYANLRCRYIGGAPLIPKGAERVEWIPKDKLHDYDLVPPSAKVLRGLGFLK